MKLRDLKEATVNRKDLENDEDKAKMAAKAADLGSFAQKVWAAKTIEAKKAAAHDMAAAFKVGGKGDFKADVDKCKTPGEVDKLCSNAMLKGEGKSTKMR